jgi:hypothetical protein
MVHSLAYRINSEGRMDGTGEEGDELGLETAKLRCLQNF